MSKKGGGKIKKIFKIDKLRNHLMKNSDNYKISSPQIQILSIKNHIIKKIM